MCILKGPFASTSKVYITAAKLRTKTYIWNDTFNGNIKWKWNRNLHFKIHHMSVFQNIHWK